MLKGEKKPNKAHFTERGIDKEIQEYIIEKMMGKRFPYLEAEKIKERKINEFKQGRDVALLTDKEERICLKRSIAFYHRMGYDYYSDDGPHDYLMSVITPKVRLAKDTATLPRKGEYFGFEAKEGLRGWPEESEGIITLEGF